MLTWGVNERVDEKTGRVSYDMALQFPQEAYATEKTTAFLKSMETFENYVKVQAVKNSKTWLNKSKISDDQIDVLFHPMLYWPRDKQTGDIDPTRSPTLKIKLDYWDEKFSCELYDVAGKNIFPDDNEVASPANIITKASNVACIIKCGGVWFANGKFGVTWKLVQAVVKPKATISGRCFISLSEEDKEKLENMSSDNDNNNVVNDDNMNVVLEDDTEEEDNDLEDDEKDEKEEQVEEKQVEENPTVVEEPIEKKKVVRKKVVKKKKIDE
jgi:hypothetical protein